MRRPRPSILTCVITLLIIVTLGCGVIGYSRVVDRLPDGIYSHGGLARFLDYLYLSLLLLTLSGRNTFGDPFLMVARWSGALFAFVALLRLAVPRLESAIRSWLAQWRGGHTIVIGLGERGRCFVRDIARLRDGHARSGARHCVGIDRVSVERESLDDDRPGRRIRYGRILLIQGDASDPKVLRRAGLHSAARVIIVTQDDLINLEIARQIVAETQRRKRSRDLDVLVHLSQPTLRLDGPSMLETSDEVSIRPFSLPALAARALQVRWPFAIQARLQGALGAHVVLIGFDDYAQELLLSLLRLGALVDQQLPTVTVFASEPTASEHRLQRNYPAARVLAASLEVLPLIPDVDLTIEEMAAVEARGRVTAIIVTGRTDTQSMALARRLRGQAHRFSLWRAPVFVHTERPAEFAQPLGSAGGSREIAELLEPFGDIETLCSLRGLQDSHEDLAQAIHQGYRDEKPRGEQAPAARPWRDVSEEYREANRRVVDHFPLLLASAGYVVRGSPLLPAVPLTFDARQMQALARQEHQSWCAERLLGGWQFGLPRDERAKRHDCLVAFEDLGAAQQQDLSQIDHMARLLGDAMDIKRAPRPTVFRERTIGLVGHNVLSLAQAWRVQEEVPRILVEALHGRERLGHGGEFWTLVTPLAPGSDLVLARAVSTELDRWRHEGEPRRFRVVVSAPGRPEQLTMAYLRSHPLPQATPDGRSTLEALDQEAEVARLLRDFIEGDNGCEWVLDLRPHATSALIEDADFAACDAYLLRRCDELIVVLDSQRYGLATGFDAEQLLGLPDGQLSAHGSAALVRRWLRERPGGGGLHIIDIAARAAL